MRVLCQQKGWDRGKGEGGKQKVGEVIRRVTCTWWLLGLALKEALLGMGGPPPALTAWTGCMTADMLTIACLLMSGRGQNHESVH